MTGATGATPEASTLEVDGDVDLRSSRGLFELPDALEKKELNVPRSGLASVAAVFDPDATTFPSLWSLFCCSGRNGGV